MSKYIIAFLIPVFAVCFSVFCQESITITTYYPAPMGVYQSLRFFPVDAAPVCDASREGLTYYDNDAAQNRLVVCREYDAGVFQWQTVSDGYWDLNGNFLTITDIAWNLGVGRTTAWDPAYKFAVEGNTYTSGYAVTQGNNYTRGHSVTGTAANPSNSYVYGDIWVGNNTWGTCVDVPLLPGEYYVGCPNGWYNVGLFYESATWTAITDTHAGPEIYAIKCCAL